MLPDRLLITLSLAMGFCAQGIGAAPVCADSVSAPDGRKHAVRCGWSAPAESLHWTKRGEEPWTLAREPRWNRAGRIWRQGEDRRPLLYGLGLRWFRGSTRLLDPDSILPQGMFDSTHAWIPSRQLLDTSRLFVLPGAGRIHWTGRYFWTSPDSLWALGEWTHSRGKGGVEALLPSDFLDHKGPIGAFRPERLRILVYEELPLVDGVLRSARELVLEGPPERTLPVVQASRRTGGTEDSLSSKLEHAQRLLLKVDRRGPHAVDRVAWLPSLNLESDDRPPTILSRTGGVTFSVDPVEPNLTPIRHRSDSDWREDFGPSGRGDAGTWIAGDKGSDRLVDLHRYRHAFLVAFLAAWNEHRPVRISPDAVWMFLLEGLLEGVRSDPDRVRAELVRHKEGKIDLVAHFGSDFPTLLGDSASWSEVARQLLDSMDRHALDQRPRRLQARFSTTTPTRALALRFRTLELYQDYFRFSGMAACGIPFIHLEGTPEDWKALRARTEALRISTTRRWLDDLAPVLDEFVATSEGNPSSGFWHSFIRFRPADESCGSYDQLDGWITRLAYSPRNVNQEDDHQALPWHLDLIGLHADHGSAPFRLIAGDVVRNFQLVSGFSGVRQDPDGALAPELGWAVWEVPVKPDK